MRLALYLPSMPNEMWTLGVQMGVTDAVTTLPHATAGGPQVWDLMSMVQLKQRFADAGLDATVIESAPPMDRVRLGVEGRDAEIEHICEMLTSMGAAGIHVWCYNWMAVFGWMRTSTTTLARGGALTSSYDHALMKDAPLTAAGRVSEEQLWDSYAYFLERVLPVAEEAKVKMALHPDDPPLSPIRGVARIMSSVEAFTRAVEMADSPYHGITFCQGNFTAMGADIPAAIRHFARRGTIHFVHFRDVRGTADRFVETFHDDGPTDMLGAMRCYQEVGFDGPMRPDHVPTLEGDANDTPGYTTRGRLYAIGYMRGLKEAVRAGM
jgi:mannonate dehydratase